MIYKGLIVELIGEICESDEMYLRRLYLIIRAHVRKQKKSPPIGGAVLAHQSADGRGLCGKTTNTNTV